MHMNITFHVYTLSEVTFKYLSGARGNSQLIQYISCVKGMIVISPDLHKAWKIPYLWRRSGMHNPDGNIQIHLATVKKKKKKKRQ